MRKVTGPRKRPRQSFGNPPLKIKKKKSSDKSAYILKIGEHLIFFKLVLNKYIYLLEIPWDEQLSLSTLFLIE